MESKRQLIDSLTSHISLYTSHSPISPNPNPNPRSSILKWFSSLSPHQRQSHLTIVDKSFTQLLLQFQFKLNSNGHGSFIILPDIPSSNPNPNPNPNSNSNSNLPTFCFRKSHGLLTRISQNSIPEKRIRESVQLFDSKEGENFGTSGSNSSCCSNCLDSVTVSREFVENVDVFVEMMDGVSDGGFLRADESVLMGSLDWLELDWLKAKGYYGLEAFVANRLELALRVSWLRLNVGKKRGMKVKEKERVACAGAGVAENVYWRKKGCVEWWVKLDDEMKRKVFRMVLGKAARLLTHDILYGKSRGIEDDPPTTSRKDKPPPRFSPQETIKTLRRNNIGSDLTLFNFNPPPNKPSSITRTFNRLLVVCEISTMLLAFEHRQFDEDSLFFSSLASVSTVSDRILRRLRGLLMVVSLDFTKLELLEDLSSTKPVKKPKQKVVSGKKGKARDMNKPVPVQRSVKSNSAPNKPAKDDRDKLDVHGTVVQETDIKKETPPAAVEMVVLVFEQGDGMVNGTLQTTSKKSKRAKKKHKKDVKSRDSTISHKSEITHNDTSIQDYTLNQPDPDQDDKKENLDFTDASNIEKGTIVDGQNVDFIDLENLKKTETQSLVSEVAEVTRKEKNLPVNKERDSGPVSTSGNPPYEWPTSAPQLSFVNSHLPATTDRLHLDVGHNWQNHFHQSGFVHTMHQVRNPPIENGCKPIPMSLDWPPMVHSINGLVPSMACGYNTGYISRRQPFKQSFSASEFVESSHIGNPPEMADEHDGHWLGEEDFAVSGMDYSQYFGGGVMYWDSSDHPVAGFSRPPSLSSDDSSWAWREADMNRTVDDMVAFSSSYSTNGLTSPSASSFCSPFEPLGYVIPSEVTGKVLHSSSTMTDLSDENVSGSLATFPGDIEAKTGDLFPYPILRPIIIPNISRDRSREFKRNHEHKSPCVPPSRREEPPIKRPPSPVVLCVPRPSQVGDSRKHRGFPTVRSGSSSPRHWGVKGWFHDGISFEECCVRVDGSEVVWPSWRKKSLSARQLTQTLPGAILQDRLIAISQLTRDQEHPDMAIPIQPPESLDCSVRKTALPVMHGFLTDEMDAFCKRVAGVNMTRKPYINWAVKRVTRSLQVLWPRSRTNVFGSNATGLSLPTSDVDLVVCLPPVRNLEPIKEAGILEGRNGIKETCLQHAARYLVNQEWVKNDSLKIVENTAIPIIMLVVEVPSDLIVSSDLRRPPLTSVDREIPGKDTADVESIRIDISFKAPSHTGLQTTELVKELTEQFPAATPLALVLKQFLADRSLDQSYSGGLSSYCLILLITRFLQHEHHYGRPINSNFGGLLMDFFYFFGNVFDPRQMRISVQGSGVYINRERGYSIDPIYIDDPLFPANNVGRNCFRIHQCIKAFADAYSTLEDQLASLTDNRDSSNGSLKLLPLIIPSIDPS
ncbi:hypothetical protein OSB04_011196 [Centaurea solstitialis]|uniref:Poly(A) RNA polymerase mitochondrial-like central palm domain-containing protein n=1 Tax=Centaurea solstitialis TaxID=347529 RepID=A0AA38WCP5_9ASTR|nr:hypothetical protein OSB04_011196 [Centaurea solstitialis]